MILKIREIRIEKKMTLEELSELTGLTKGYLSKIENGLKKPSIATLEQIASALKICPKKLIHCDLNINCDRCAYK